jgi:hypothetical protein
MLVNPSTCSAVIRKIQMAFVATMAILFAAPAYGTVILSASGLSSANVPVDFEAQLSIAGDNLTVQLTNNSPVNSLNPNDLLGSFYFDIVDSFNNRPTLAYVTATGDVYLADKNNPDTLQTAGANLKALLAGDNTWQYKAMNAVLVPNGGFGIGTVGNSSAAPNNFMGSIVGGIDYSIYKGDITTSNLDGKLLVNETATFTFSGVSAFTESNISPVFAFGLGTAPDSFMVPEPSSFVLAALGLIGLVVWRRRKR